MNYSKEETIVVMCNGKSVLNADFDLLSRVSTFGLNMAYKWYYKNDWWPTYHGSFDYKINRDFHEPLMKMMEDNTPIQKFFYVEKYKTNSSKFFHINLNREYDDAGGKWNNSEKSFNKFHHFGNSGTNACSVAAALGYKNILLLGADNTQQDMYDGVKELNNNELVMTKTPDLNPCYWFNYYFEKGDTFNKPRKNVYHTPWWSIFSEMAKENNVKVVNCSDVSHENALTCFDVGDINDEIKKVI